MFDLRWRSLPVLLWLLTAVPYATAQKAEKLQSRFPVTSAEVVAALQRAGLPVSELTVQLPVAITAREQGPALEVRAAVRVNAKSLRLRVECRPAISCVPFFVAADFASDQAAQTALNLLHAGPGRIAPVATAEMPQVSAGHRAVLLLQGGHTHITLPVIAIDTGHTGEEVRVTTLDRKQTFRGTVGAGDTVNGELP